MSSATATTVGRATETREVIHLTLKSSAPGQSEQDHGGSSDALKPTEDEDDIAMPTSFNIIFLTTFFLVMSNFTVVLPTIHDYMHSLGAGSFLAGATFSASIAPSILMGKFAPHMVKRSYIPLIAVVSLTMVTGNVMYGLGQLAGTWWLLFAGQFLRGLLGSTPLLFAFQNAVTLCVGKSKRSGATARMWNVCFLGMGMGPMIAAGLAYVNFSVGALRVDESTNPGWFYAICWLCLLAVLPFVSEPERRFRAPANADSSDVETAKHERKIEFLPTAWCVTVVFLSSTAIAVWETSASIITQKYFQWSVQASSLFIGAIFLTGLFCGEAVKALKHRIRSEADLVIGGLSMVLISSLMLYWYIPVHYGLSAAQLATAEVPYIIGSVLILNAANTNRTFSGTMANRAALAAGGVPLQTRVGLATSVAVTAGRSVGGIAGMGVASLPGGPNWAAGLLSAFACVSLVGLGMPELRSKLREA
eukprot:TRINITY_DN60697_c0_g1_i1.p1 TRINITY_DN60697_c0_g1~~TRINITY_DN60697_c0_g1_i1.p1  ORF type:complete len:476 (-),score=76.67 TRINITY_DN60697_c0_g1_i1:103-1530(-)